MQNNLAKVFSVIFHPLVMPSIGILLIFFSGIYSGFLTFEQKRAIFLIVFTGTLLLPVCLIPLYMLFKIIRNVEMNSLRERILPLFFTTAIYFFTFYLISGFSLPRVINLFLTGTIICVSAVFFISILWKISAHMVGVGGLAGMLLAVSFIHSLNLLGLIIPVIIVAGLLGFSRLELKAHTPAQVYAGFLKGAGIMLLVFYI